MRGQMSIRDRNRARTSQKKCSHVFKHCINRNKSSVRLEAFLKPIFTIKKKVRNKSIEMKSLSCFKEVVVVVVWLLSCLTLFADSWT